MEPTLTRHLFGSLVAIGLVCGARVGVESQPTTGAIAGRIVNESGDGVPYLYVRALRLTTNGRPTREDAGTIASTDDRGHYRLFDLPAGDYAVLASPTHPRGGVVFVSHAPLLIPATPRLGYVPTFYPGTTSGDAVRVLRVTAGRDTIGIDFSAVLARLARITIKAVDSTGRPLPRLARVSLRPLEEFDDGFPQSERGDDGTFEFSNVRPGGYALFASPDRSGGEGFYSTVVVDGADRTIAVATNTGATLSGRIVLEQSRQPNRRDWTPDVTVWASPSADASFETQAGRVEVRAGERFVLTGLRGRLVLTTSLPGDVVVSVHRGAEDITNRVIELSGTEIIDDIVIRVTP